MRNTGRLAIIMLLHCLSASPTWAQTEISTPYLSSANNFRDVAGISTTYGGTGYANETAYNGTMRTGVFYRSTQLGGLSDTDLETISNLGITQVIDLRTPSEIATTPDILPIGAVAVNHNIYGIDPPEIPPTSSLAAVITYSHELYQGFVIDSVQRSGLKGVLLDLAGTQGAALYHCAGGKDRTGWVSFLLESIAGVSSSTIMNDYLATNDYTEPTINAYLEYIYNRAGGGAAGDAAVAIYRPLLGVQEDFLQAGIDQMIADYGSLDAYLTQGIGLTQADIHVLRGKMVYYQTLPGQPRLSGNAAAGAEFLKALQNSPLSGQYSAYNDYLQSAIDAGVLGGVETRVGGQVHADSAAYLLRQPQSIDDTLTPYAHGQNLEPGTADIWISGVAGDLEASSRSGIAGSHHRSYGVIAGGTHRFSGNASAYLGAGVVANDVESADARVDADNYVAVFGGRYAYSALESGPYVGAGFIAGTVDYRSTRLLDDGLGTASGQTDGKIYSGRVDFGNIFDVGPFAFTPQVGVLVIRIDLDGFNEKGSELALKVDNLVQTIPSFLADLRFDLKERQIGHWALKSTAVLGYERALDTAKVTGKGSLYGYSVSQNSAYDSRNLAKFGIGGNIGRGAVSLLLGANAVVGENTKGITGANINLVYNF